MAQALTGEASGAETESSFIQERTRADVLFRFMVESDLQNETLVNYSHYLAMCVCALYQSEPNQCCLPCCILYVYATNEKYK
jgi:hypothetical protein